jgi:hypothetical protein
MDHKEAKKIQAVERYLLHELMPNERDAFEEHYFVCAECSAELQSGAVLCANMGAVLEEEPQKVFTLPSRRRFASFWQLRWAMAAMVVVLASVVSVQNLVTIPHLQTQARLAQAPRPLPTLTLASSAARGSADESTITISKSDPLGLYVDIPPYPPYESYTCEVYAENGKRVFTVDIPAEQAHDTVQLFVPAGVLVSSHYVLVVRGQYQPASPRPEGDELSRHTFYLQTRP